MVSVMNSPVLMAGIGVGASARLEAGNDIAPFDARPAGMVTRQTIDD